MRRWSHSARRTNSELLHARGLLCAGSRELGQFSPVVGLRCAAARQARGVAVLAQRLAKDEPPTTPSGRQRLVGEPRAAARTSSGWSSEYEAGGPDVAASAPKSKVEIVFQPHDAPFPGHRGSAGYSVSFRERERHTPVRFLCGVFCSFSRVSCPRSRRRMGTNHASGPSRRHRDARLGSIAQEWVPFLVTW